MIKNDGRLGGWRWWCLIAIITNSVEGEKVGLKLTEKSLVAPNEVFPVENICGEEAGRCVLGTQQRSFHHSVPFSILEPPTICRTT